MIPPLKKIKSFDSILQISTGDCGIIKLNMAGLLNIYTLSLRNPIGYNWFLKYVFIAQTGVAIPGFSNLKIHSGYRSYIHCHFLLLW